MLYCVKPFNTTLICLLAILLAACKQQAVGYGFAISDVSVSRGYQVLDIQLAQDLDLSDQAREAVYHGVTLTIRLDMELRNDNNMTLVRHEARRFHIRYLPMVELFELSEEKSEKLQTFSRLRHALALIASKNVQLSTGPLPPGNYELRTRIRLDEGMLPAPMQLPALFSPQWRHDSEWSVWPFKINV